MSDTAKSAITIFFQIIYFVTIPSHILVLAFWVHPIIGFIGYPTAVFAFVMYHSWKDEKTHKGYKH